MTKTASVFLGIFLLLVLIAARQQGSRFIPQRGSVPDQASSIQNHWNHARDKTAAIVADLDALSSLPSTHEQLSTAFGLFHEYGVDGLGAPTEVRQAACRFLVDAAAGRGPDPRTEGPAFCGNGYMAREKPVSFLLRYADHGSTVCREAVAALSEGTTYSVYVRNIAREQLRLFDQFTYASAFFEDARSTERDRAAALAQLIEVSYEIPTAELLEVHGTAERYDTQYLAREYLIRRRVSLTPEQKKTILGQARSGIDSDSVLGAWGADQLDYFRR